MEYLDNPELSVEDIADDINELTQEGKLFWSYGLIRETIDFWDESEHEEMLSDESKTILSSAREAKEEGF